MTYKQLPLGQLAVNRANDRHGELENETAAIAWLFNNREQHMRNLARDIVTNGQIYEPPLVGPVADAYVIFDGNRRVTCLKLLSNPRRAPSIELQEFFARIRAEWKGDFPGQIECQIETDRDRIDDILFRRHTGSQAGIGQSNWDDRMKTNFINRTGTGGGTNVAEQIESMLTEADLLPRRKIPRSNLNRLLSAEAFRNRAGFTIKAGRIELTHQEPVVLHALARIADDLANRRQVLEDIWDVDGKRAYLDKLEAERVLPPLLMHWQRPKPREHDLVPVAPDHRLQGLQPPARRDAQPSSQTPSLQSPGRVASNATEQYGKSFNFDCIYPSIQTQSLFYLEFCSSWLSTTMSTKSA